MAKIMINHLYKKYSKDKHTVVKDFHMEIEDKEFLVLVGPSGCGKSTVLRMIAGLEDITEGEIYIGDTLVNHLPPKDRDIAMVFQNYALYPNMSVYENIAFGLRLRKLPKHEIDLSVKRAARILELDAYLDRKPGQLSGGQRQRVALGRAIVRNPQVFLMDEPLSNLDAKLRAHMRMEIIKLHKSLAATFVYVTHDQIEAMTMGDRIAVMKDGVIQQVDTPEVIYSTPSNMFVASFIGSPPMNFIQGRVLENIPGKLEFHTQRFWLKIPEHAASLLIKHKQVNRTVTLGIRPEHMELAKGADEQTAIPAYYKHSELMGADRFLHLDIHQKQPLIVRADPGIRLEEDEITYVTPNMSEALFFHLETGDRIS
ncbi:ABC transporter ATP-binding protein [Paenibacillus sp. 32352]|uniref:ABC transporter ATP-binding protein n=1 Tax=Paenibacillus sp. 32352 TaxID=1969111 RepID=UPI0009ADE12D|nr:sn-glycerol-3-phosphate ABC transporter ATP-binding protein UgpC [Paenibacillus sp. 32352]